MSIVPLMFRSLVRLIASLVRNPTSALTTLLYYSDLLPRNLNLERLVQRELLDDENYLFNFLINVLRCFWPNARWDGSYVLVNVRDLKSIGLIQEVNH